MARGISVRLSVQEAAQVKAALESVGTAGERALGKLEHAARQAEQRGGGAMKGTGAAAHSLTGQLRTLGTTAAFIDGPLGGVASRFTALGSLASGAGIALGGLVLGLGALTAGLGAAARAYDEFERRQLKIEQVLRTTNFASGRTAGQINQLAVDIGRDTLASANDVRDAAAQLLTFKSIAGEVFDDTLRRAQDLAALGMGSLSSATLQLGKALEDPASGLTQLRRVGVSFTQQQREMILAMREAGDVAGAQTEILRILEGQVGGAGEAEGKGVAGAFDLLSENVTRFMERLGGETGLNAGLRGTIGLLALLVEYGERSVFGGPIERQIADKMDELARLQAAMATERTGIFGGYDLGGMRVETEKRVEALRSEIDALEHKREVEAEAEAIAARLAQQAAEAAAADEAAARAAEKAAEAAAALAKERERATATVAQAIKALQDEQTALHLNERERFIYQQLLKVEGDLQVLTTDKRELATAMIREQAGALFDLRAEQEAEAEATRAAAKAQDDVRKAREKAREQAARDAARDAEARRRALERPFENAAQGIQSAFADAFENVFSGGVSSFNDLRDEILRVMARTAAEVTAMLVFQPVVGGVLSAVGLSGLSSGLTGVGSASGAGAGSLGLGGLPTSPLSLLGGLTSRINAFGASLGFAPVSGGAAAPGAFAAGAAGPPQLAGGFFGSGATLAGTLGAAGLGAMGGALLAQLTGGNTMGGTIGGALGAGIGFAVGGPVGGLIGGAIGGLGGGLLGPGKSVGPNATAVLGVDNGRFLLTGSGADNGGNRGEVERAANQAAAFLNALADQFGLDAVTNLPRVAKTIGTGAAAPRGAAGSVSGLVSSILQAGGLAGEDDLVNRALRLSNAGDVQQNIADAMALSRLLGDPAAINDNATQAERALAALNDEFDRMAELAARLGVEEGRIAAARQTAIADLTTGFNEAVRLQILAFTDPLQAALAEFEAANDNRLREAEALGADLVQVERLAALQRQAIIERANSAANGSLQTLLQRLTGSSASPLAPSVSLANAEARFNEVSALALAGDATARGEVTAAADNLLALARTSFASGPEFFERFDRVVNVLETLTGAGSGATSTDLLDEIAGAIGAGNADHAELLRKVLAELTATRTLLEQQGRQIELLQAAS